ncbi:MAG: divalent-cation tolerance protein CutA [Acidimicrobiales bacterium]
MSVDADRLLAVVTTIGSRHEADNLARALVEARLAACVQVEGPIQSHYRWEGRLTESQEWRLVAKTTAALYERVAAAVTDAHPYDLPQLVAFETAEASPAYRDWVVSSTRSRTEPGDQPSSGSPAEEGSAGAPSGESRSAEADQPG